MGSDLPRSWSPSATTARQMEVIRLLAIGVKYPAIAKQLGNITESAARKLGRRALVALAKDLRSMAGFESALALHMVRYDMLLAVWMPKALAGDDKAAQICGTYLGQIADINGFKQILKADQLQGDDAPAPADLVAGVLDRLEQLHHRLNPGGVIDGEVVDEQDEDADEEIQLPTVTKEDPLTVREDPTTAAPRA